ncbi:MAG: hypothetical protein IJM64_05300 [Ottowia sp.]|nr:hypothetical protein [Ottowia sp.]
MMDFSGTIEIETAGDAPHHCVRPDSLPAGKLGVLHPKWSRMAKVLCMFCCRNAANVGCAQQPALRAPCRSAARQPLPHPVPPSAARACNCRASAPHAPLLPRNGRHNSGRRRCHVTLPQQDLKKCWTKKRASHNGAPFARRHIQMLCRGLAKQIPLRAP